MAYEVTATRKRPQSFDELTGQEFVVASLGNTLKSGRIAHAYLFSGPRGVGKTSAARILAKSLNCETGPTATPCGTCTHCTEIARGNALDVIEIDGASNTSVNDVREIRDEVLFSPSSSRYKVYIIDEVHMLSNSAFNALLKTIEEPPPYIVFIFATTEVHKVPATIRSRCQQFNFRLIGIEAIVERVRNVTEEMGIEADDAALFWIAKEAGGSLRDAYTLYDQIVSFSESGISMQLIQDKLGLVGFDRIDRLSELLAEGSAREAIEMADEIISQGVSVEQIINDLTDYFRGLLFARHGITREALIGYRPESFSTGVSKLQIRQIEYVIGELLSFYRTMRYSLNQRFELELLLSRLSIAAEYIDHRELVHRLEALKREIVSPDAGRADPGRADPGKADPGKADLGRTNLGEGVPGMGAPGKGDAGRVDLGKGDASRTDLGKAVPGAGESSARSDNDRETNTEASADPKPISAAGDPVDSIASTRASEHPREVPSEQRKAIIDAIRREHLSLGTALENCEAWRVEGDEITIISPSRFHAESIKRETTKVTQAVRRVTEREFRIQVRTAEEGDSDGDEDSDRGVEMIKRVFRGEIV